MDVTRRREIRLMEAGDYRAARRIAAGWHGGRDRNITGLSHGREWKTDDLITEIENNIGAQLRLGDAEARENVVELEAFKKWADTTWDIHAVWSAFGHQFQHTDGAAECFSCGGRWDEVHDSGTDVHHGRYRSLNGEDPVQCPGHHVVHGEADCTADGCSTGGHQRTLGAPGCRECTFPCNCMICR